MSTTQPIRSREALDNFKRFYVCQRPNLRNYTLIVLGLNTALRISDILHLKWKDIFDEKENHVREHLELTEQKTGKQKVLILNDTVCRALYDYKDFVFAGIPCRSEQYLFVSQKGINTPLCRSQAYRIVKTAAEASGLCCHVSCHSLRKTFGYHAWKQGVPPALLMDIYNHSSYKITKRYLCIEQDERDEVYRKVCL